MSDQNKTNDQKTIDYLDHPPQRYAHEFQRNSGSREMVEDADGAWVKHEDMDLYMFEGAQLMKQAIATNQQLREALVKSVAVIQTWHNQGIPVRECSKLWDIYWRNAPEMKPIREALTALKDVK